MTATQKRLDETLARITRYPDTDLDSQAKEVISDLLQRLGSFTRFEEHGVDPDTANVLVFHSRKGSFTLFEVAPGSVPMDLAEQARNMSEQQFSTHAENVIYCEGTEELLGLLTQYCSIRTATALVMAVPLSRMAGGPAGGPHKAYINVQHLRTMYGKERTVNIVLMSSFGCYIFKFEEQANLGKLPPWLMVDETAEEL